MFHDVKSSISYQIQNVYANASAKPRWDSLCSNQMCHGPRHTPRCAAKGILRHQRVQKGFGIAGMAHSTWRSTKHSDTQ